MGGRADNVAAQAAKELHRFRANQRKIDFDVPLPPLLQLTDHGLEHIDIQAAAKAAIGRDNDITDAFDFALNQPGMFVIGIGIGKVPDHTANAVGIRPRCFHLRLRLADLRRSHHLHRLGDLLHVCHAADLGANFFFAGHITQYS